MANTLKQNAKRKIEAFELAALKKSTTPERAMLDYLLKDGNPIVRYIQMKGHRVPKTGHGRAILATDLYNQSVENFAGSNFDGETTFDDAETAYLTSVENGLLEGNMNEPADMFVSDALSIAKGLGGKLLQGINKKRASKGKKPILAKVQANITGAAPVNATAEQLRRIESPANPVKESLLEVMPPADVLARKIDEGIAKAKAVKGDTTPVSVADGNLKFGNIAREAVSEVETLKTKQKVKQYMPFIIGGVVLLAIVFYFMGKRK